MSGSVMLRQRVALALPSAYEWLTRGTFVASLELERPIAPAAASSAPGGAARTMAIRLKFYQIK
jgi:hypothetical protein